jgi:hypothetical protein
VTECEQNWLTNLKSQKYLSINNGKPAGKSSNPNSKFLYLKPPIFPKLYPGKYVNSYGAFSLEKEKTKAITGRPYSTLVRRNWYISFLVLCWAQEQAPKNWVCSERKCYQRMGRWTGALGWNLRPHGQWAPRWRSKNKYVVDTASHPHNIHSPSSVSNSDILPPKVLSSSITTSQAMPLT